ncbi:hypothetical protein QR680_002620 [Steinernema hermaphroditum]|uniref:Sulfhydryl oxidase n=1 Tax=Steinernema hermaphroditum TaxID=289476 RepID=A0AA39LIL7_9BILA|nr:hypothetical protein QR680_002620 [Steinernema hermaphroditum]
MSTGFCFLLPPTCKSFVALMKLKLHTTAFPPFLLFFAVLLATISLNHAAISSMTYVPMGNNPTLYRPGAEPIMHLDELTFTDTVLGQDHAFLVEFYADWCGHCRAFAPFFREFASLVQSWNRVVTVAAMNCADSFNTRVCRENGVTHFPMIKYYPRAARHASNAITLEASHSGSQLRDQLTRTIVNEFNQFRYPDWPNFIYINVDSSTTYGTLWQGVAESADYLAIIIEQYESVSPQFMLDLSSRSHEIGTRRALASSPITQMLMITQFPYVALFSRDRQRAIYMNPYSANSMTEINNALANIKGNKNKLMLTTTPRTTISTTTQIPTVNCERFPERCRDMYFVSETDMLKAMYMALHDEVIRANDVIQGSNFTHLYNFVDLLAEHFPVLTFSNEIVRRGRNVKRSSSSILKNSERARLVFSHLREFLRTKNDTQLVSTSDWEHHFNSVERVYAFPFPVNSSWQHCKGTTPQFRGYTCGLWTTFHALTVHTYMDTIKEHKVNALKPLKSIQGWVSSFFGCEHCKRHFMHMTTELFPMTARRVRHSHDMMMYLWRAHNIVNNRLHGDVTEDPQFTKMQFPALFLCPTCHSGGHFSRRQIRNFLLRYYGNIKPHNRLARKVLHFY